MSDAEAIRASLAEPERFAVVFDRHFDAVHAYVQKRVGADLADEVAAETFTCAFDRRHRYDSARTDARPWLLGIAANLLRRHWRSERRRLAAYGKSAADVGANEAAPPFAVELARALRTLPRREREPLLLLAWADLSYEEIALALAIPVGTVRSRIARGRDRLRARLGTGAPNENPRPREAHDV